MLKYHFIKIMKNNLFIYDGDCEFCKRAILKLKEGKYLIYIIYKPYQELDLIKYKLTKKQVEKEVIFINNTKYYYGAIAFGKLLQYNKKLYIRLFGKFINLPVLSLLSGLLYKLIANNRYFISKILFK